MREQASRVISFGFGIKGKGISRGRPENRRVSGFSDAIVGSREQGLIDIAPRIPSSHTSRKGAELIEIHCASCTITPSSRTKSQPLLLALDSAMLAKTRTWSDEEAAENSDPKRTRTFASQPTRGEHKNRGPRLVRDKTETLKGAMTRDSNSPEMAVRGFKIPRNCTWTEPGRQLRFRFPLVVPPLRNRVPCPESICGL
ncbi:hypothetical protein VNO77_04261 [Canavalia gladiata]|uniref:Uncharacterized protein n=1 Tax=Canavalia gladiata TaxID=3824 RepID=A0AAN9MWV9_CANGL